MRPLTLVPPLLLACVAAAPRAQEHDRLHTDRHSPRLLRLPKEDDAFGFVVFGDRTSGPPAGIHVLAQAVVDVNLLDPDLVMTVGDLVQGYNTTEPWLEQMREYRATMDRLHMPWFPVAGNHDIYWRGAGKPLQEHEQDYETHFGPLWYAFEHKRCWFVVLYSDEGNATTGERAIDKPECQKISVAQLAWLEQTLAKAKGAAAVFVFLHHPRWLRGQYGDDWERVHRALVAAGNVRAVFAGHIHRMRWDGVRDGIEYCTLAAVGAELAADLPGAGYLHHFNVVTVRQGRISIATIPVGTVLDPRQITGEVSTDCLTLERDLRVRQADPLTIGADGSIDQEVAVVLHNPCSRSVALTLELDGHDRRLCSVPDHVHLDLAAEQSTTLHLRVLRPASPLDANCDAPAWLLGCDYLGAGLRVTLPEKRFPVPLAPPPALDARPAAIDGALRLDGQGACLRLASARLLLADGAFSAEAWLCASDLSGRRAILSKAEGSEWGLFAGEGKPWFSVHVGPGQATAALDAAALVPGQWHHLAGVFDGEEVRLYLDGVLTARAPAQGSRLANDLPLYVGADPNAKAQPASCFAGLLDEVRVSRGARYSGERFAPERRLAPDADTLLLLHLDADVGPWTADASGHGLHPERLGSARCALSSAAAVR